MSVKIISQEIANILEPLKTQGKVKSIEQYSSGNIIGYPRIQIEFQGLQSDYLTNQERLVEYEFDVVITQEITDENATSQTGTDTMNQLVQEVVELLDDQVNSGTPLNNSVDFIRPITTTRAKNIQELPLITQLVTIKCVKTL